MGLNAWTDTFRAKRPSEDRIITMHGTPYYLSPQLLVEPKEGKVLAHIGIYAVRHHLVFRHSSSHLVARSTLGGFGYGVSR